MQDWSLIRQYVDDHSQEAFAALVGRHVNFVYSTCLRELGDAALADDVTQAVFLILAQKAATLREETVLSGWLFNTARFACKNALRKEHRRQRQEQKAAEHIMRDSEIRIEEDKRWADIEPLLHDGLATLASLERQAVLLRYFENRSLRDTGAALGISEDAARMRVARAVEKLRRHFARHGFAVPVALLAALLSERAVQAAPASCVAASAGAASSAAPTAAVTPSIKPQVAALSRDVMRGQMLRKAAIAAGVVAACGVGGSILHFARPPQAAPRVAAAPVPRRVQPAAAKTVAAPRAAAALADSTRRADVPLIMAPPDGSSLRVPSGAAATQRPPVAPPAPRRVAEKKRAAHEVPAIAQAIASGQSTTKTADTSATIEEAVPAVPAESIVASRTASGAAGASVVPPSAASPDAAALSATAPALPAEPVVAAPAQEVLPTAPTARAAISVVRGRVLSVNDSDSSIALSLPDGLSKNGAVKTITVPVEAQVYINNSAANLEEIQPGMMARVRVLNGQNAIAVFAREALKPAAPKNPKTKGANKAQNKKNNQLLNTKKRPAR